MTIYETTCLKISLLKKIIPKFIKEFSEKPRYDKSEISYAHDEHMTNHSKRIRRIQFVLLIVRIILLNKCKTNN